MIIAVEGMDGAGKTTICKHIERRFGFLNIEKPTKYLFKHNDGKIDYDLFYEILNKVYDMNNKFRSEFFGLGNELAVSMYPTSDIVLDRHFASNYYWNGDESLNNYYKDLIMRCGKPDITIFLYAKPIIRYKRLKKRNSKDMDLYDKSIFEDGTEKHIKFFEENDIPYVMIDTNDKTIGEVCREVDWIVKKIQYSKDDRGAVKKYGCKL